MSDMPIPQRNNALPAAERQDTATKSEGSTGHGHDAGTKPPAQVFPFLGPPSVPGDLGTLGGYRILRVLGEGGMGYVFHGEDDQLRRSVALKVMKPSVAAGAIATERFLREGRAAAGLKSDHVVTIYQVGEENGVAFLAMEFLDGANLEDWLRARNGTAAISAGLRILRDVLKGLTAAHAKGMVHRDIKPANLWVDSSTGRIKVLDFGLTRAVSGEDQLTAEGALVGTPSYMAPEQARSQPVDARADLFSAGVVLYRILTGVSPFQRGDTIATLTALAIETPPSADRVNAAVPADVALFLERMMSKSPAGRPADAKKALYELTVIRKRHQAAGTPPSESSGPVSAPGIVPLSSEPERPLTLPPMADPAVRTVTRATTLPTARPSETHVARPLGPRPQPRVGRAVGVIVGLALMGLLVAVGLAVWAGLDQSELLTKRSVKDDSPPSTIGRGETKAPYPETPDDGPAITAPVGTTPVTKPTPNTPPVRPMIIPFNDPKAKPDPDPDRTAARFVLATGGTVDVLYNNGFSKVPLPSRVSRLDDLPAASFQLITVDLRDTDFADDDLVRLIECHHLTSVQLTGSKVTREGVSELRSRLRNVVVQWDDTPPLKSLPGGKSEVPSSQKGGTQSPDKGKELSGSKPTEPSVKNPFVLPGK